VIRPGEEELLCLSVIAASEAQLRDAYARLCCEWKDGGPDGTCVSCGHRPGEHWIGWAERFLGGQVDAEAPDATRAARRIAEALEAHAEARLFFVADGGSSFRLFCAFLDQDDQAKRKALREWLFLPWSPALLRRAIAPALRAHERLKKRRMRERKRDAA